MDRGSASDATGARRVIERDRHGTLLTALSWADHGLAEATTRIPDGRFVTIEPRATRDAPWGVSDRLWLGPRPGRDGAEPLVDFAAVEYTALDGIPPLADPSRLPPGAGTTVLNLLARLAADQGRRRLRYRGPYPTEQLFLALLECFRYVDDPDDPLAAFLAGELAWDPAPFERLVERDGITVHVRGRVERVTWRGKAYHRPDWQTVRRLGHRRVREAAASVVCSLWALGAPIEDHLRLAPDGTLLDVVARPPGVATPRPLATDVVDGIVASVAATSVPALAPFVRETGRRLELAWAPVERDLSDVDGTRGRFAPRLREVARARLHETTDRAARVALGFTLLGELAALVGDPLRLAAQHTLAARPIDEQRTALEVTEDPERKETAAVIGRAVERLLAELT